MPAHELPTITASNYFSPAINAAYMSVSQFKAFRACEAGALAELRGDYVRPSTSALLVGSYVDAFFSNEMEAFKADNLSIFTAKGTLKADYVKAEQVIERIQQDRLFESLMMGSSQAIRTGTIAGVPFKIKIDSLLDLDACEAMIERFPDMAPTLLWADGAIIDLKVMRDLKPQWVSGRGKISFVEAWGYDLQMAVYQAIEGNGLPCFIAAATKEEPPNIEVFTVPQEEMDARLMEVEEMVGRYDAIKRGDIEPERCGECAWCRQSKVLTGAVDYRTYGFEEEE